MEDLAILFILDNNLWTRDESTGLLPCMLAATCSDCGLDTVFMIAIMNLDNFLEDYI